MYTLFFLFLLKNIDCGYSLELPHRGGSNVYPQSMFWSEIWKISEFLSEFFYFFGGKMFNIFEYACFRNVSWSISTKECFRTRRGSDPRPADHQSHAHPTEPPWLARYSFKGVVLAPFIKGQALKERLFRRGFVCRNQTGLSWPKHRKLNELVSDQNFNCSSKNNIKFTDIFAEKVWVLKLLTFPH